jgi:hypothetical protein
MRARAPSPWARSLTFQARGQLDDAPRIRNEEELPVYDSPSATCARARHHHGQDRRRLVGLRATDEASKSATRKSCWLAIARRRRSRAVTMGRIADILQARGHLTRPRKSK